MGRRDHESDGSSRGGRNGYKPLEEYGVVGNLETVALVAPDGSVDWLPFPHVEDPSVLAAILDPEAGGHFRVAPIDPFESTRRYVDRTNVLETAFETDGGAVTVTDFMPPAGKVDHPKQVLYRKLDCSAGHVDVGIEFAPRFDYARVDPTFETTDQGVRAEGAGERTLLEAPTTLDVGERTITGTVTLEAGTYDAYFATFGDPLLPVEEAESVGEWMAGLLRFGNRAWESDKSKWAFRLHPVDLHDVVRLPSRHLENYRQPAGPLLSSSSRSVLPSAAGVRRADPSVSSDLPGPPQGPGGRPGAGTTRDRRRALPDRRARVQGTRRGRRRAHRVRDPRADAAPRSGDPRSALQTRLEGALYRPATGDRPRAATVRPGVPDELRSLNRAPRDGSAGVDCRPGGRPGDAPRPRAATRHLYFEEAPVRHGHRDGRGDDARARGK